MRFRPNSTGEVSTLSSFTGDRSESLSWMGVVLTECSMGMLVIGEVGIVVGSGEVGIVVGSGELGIVVGSGELGIVAVIGELGIVVAVGELAIIGLEVIEGVTGTLTTG